MHAYHGIKWEFQPLASKVDFLDITISIHNGIISTTLYDKVLNLYMYITPHSYHPPDVLTGSSLGIVTEYTPCVQKCDISATTSAIFTED